MLENELKIFIEQLREGDEEEFSLLTAPAILAVEEPELSFTEPVQIRGRAYTTSSDLVMYLQCQTNAEMPCAICNEKTTVSLDTGMQCHTFPLSDFKSKIFDYTDLVREEILMHLPQFVECQPEKCPARSVLNLYSKKQGNNGPDFQEAIEYPFANLK